jgi:hypothetical protein
MGLKGGKVLEKKYVYRKHLREPAKFFLIVGSLFVLGYSIGSIAFVSAMKAGDKVKLGLIILGVGVGIIAFLSMEFLLIYFAMYRRFKKINVTLTEYGILYNNAKGETIIPFENIKTLKFPSVKYTGGWLKIVHTKGNIRLTVVLENVGDLVKNLKDKLDERNMSHVYNENKMYKFFKTSEYSDQSWERLYEIVKFLMIFIVTNLIISGVVSGFITEAPVKFLVIFSGFIGPMLPYLVSEIIFGRKLAKGAMKESFSVPKRDKTFENKVYRWAFGAYTIIYFVMIIILIL